MLGAAAADVEADAGGDRAQQRDARRGRRWSKSRSAGEPVDERRSRTTAPAAAIVASHERVAPIVYSETTSGSANGASTGVETATARMTASTANGQRRRNSSGSDRRERRTATPTSGLVLLGAAGDRAGHAPAAPTSAATARRPCGATACPATTEGPGHALSVSPARVRVRLDLAGPGAPCAGARATATQAITTAIAVPSATCTPPPACQVADPVDRDLGQRLARVAEEADRLAAAARTTRKNASRIADHRAARADERRRARRPRPRSSAPASEHARACRRRSSPASGVAAPSASTIAPAAVDGQRDGEDRQHDGPGAGRRATGTARCASGRWRPDRGRRRTRGPACRRWRRRSRRRSSAISVDDAGALSL